MQLDANSYYKMPDSAKLEGHFMFETVRYFREEESCVGYLDKAAIIVGIALSCIVGIGFLLMYCAWDEYQYQKNWKPDVEPDIGEDQIIQKTEAVKRVFKRNLPPIVEEFPTIMLHEPEYILKAEIIEETSSENNLVVYDEKSNNDNINEIMDSLPTWQARKLHASSILFNNNLSQDREMFIKAILEAPQQLELDFARLGTVIIGNQVKPLTDFEGLSSDDIYKFFFDVLENYIKNHNHEIEADRNKIDEVLNSLIQTFSNDFFIKCEEMLPNKDIWIVPNKHSFSYSEAKFEFENKDSDILVVSKKNYKTYMLLDEYDKSINDPNDVTKKMEVTLEVTIKHSLSNNDTSFNYKLTIDGKTESWDSLDF